MNDEGNLISHSNRSRQATTPYHSIRICVSVENKCSCSPATKCTPLQGSTWKKLKFSMDIGGWRIIIITTEKGLSLCKCPYHSPLCKWAELILCFTFSIYSSCFHAVLSLSLSETSFTLRNRFVEVYTDFSTCSSLLAKRERRGQHCTTRGWTSNSTGGKQDDIGAAQQEYNQWQKDETYN